MAQQIPTGAVAAKVDVDERDVGFFICDRREGASDGRRPHGMKRRLRQRRSHERTDVLFIIQDENRGARPRGNCFGHDVALRHHYMLPP